MREINMALIVHKVIRSSLLRTLGSNLSVPTTVGASHTNDLFTNLQNGKDYSTDSTTNSGPSSKSTNKNITISRAMRAYIERAQSYDEMMKAEVADYEIGKRHLANIMGEDPDNFTQEDIRRAIDYLLPSGLFDKKARPVLKDPYEIYPKKKAAQFGLDGRPYHWMYFTTLPNYYSLLYEIAWKMEDLKALEDKLRGEQKLNEVDNDQLSLTSSEWITHQKFKDRLVENVQEKEYNHFLVLMERLVSHPLAYTEAEFIMDFRDMMGIESEILEPPVIEVDSDGRQFAAAKGMRRKMTAFVRVYKPGTGKISINNSDLSYFSNLLYRESLMFPLSVTNLIGKVDIEAEVADGGGINGLVGGATGRAGAIRSAVSKALTAFVDSEVREQLRLTGMLTQDPRVSERKKPGQEKARKKFTWKKR